jgi:anti-sigma B factor antagonist
MTVIDIAPLARAGPSAPTTIRLHGDIDIFTTKALRLRLLSALRYSTSVLILDMSDVSFCDASGLGVLVGIQARARAQGVTLALTGIQPYLTRILRITGLDRSLPITI